MLTFNTPAALAVGRRGSRIAVYDLEGARFFNVDVATDAELAEVGVEGLELRAHMALASFSTSIAKAAAVDGDVYILDSKGLRPIKKIKITLNNIKMKEYGSWEDIWNKLLIIRGRSSALVLGVSRAGSLLHVNFARSDEAHIKAALNALEMLGKFGDVSVACSCRLGPVPIEILSRRKTDYILVKIYMNTASDHGDRVLVIRWAGGNIYKRLVGSLNELNKFIEEVI
ncbi:MAG: hypothetical protein JZD41_05385 [Thermoproteus sp.]|nr:hypothetical protein [Thermoproteus sp.]